VDSSSKVHITEKGVDEVARRIYKLGIKKRSVLIQLTQPVTINHLLQKTVFPKNEIVEAIQSLAEEGFVSIEGYVASQAVSQDIPKPSKITENSSELGNEIILSEAKFLLIDFCVDSFGTQSEAIAAGIHACKDASHLGLLLKKLISVVEKQYPGQLPALQIVIRKINETS